MASGSVTREETAFHHQTHRDLLWSPRDSVLVGQVIDAIVVPTIRPPTYLNQAANLALALDRPLVTFHSGTATTAQLARTYLPAKVDLIAIDVRPRKELSLPAFDTCELLDDGIFTRRSDLSIKRNLALVLARQLCCLPRLPGSRRQAGFVRRRRSARGRRRPMRLFLPRYLQRRLVLSA